MLVGYFTYVAGLSPFFWHRTKVHSQPVLIALAVIVFELALVWGERGRFGKTIEHIRDWTPI
ncbi:MAG: hypothetical protein ACJ74Y_03990, partial [Bryobacteraceae bacterium]